MNKELYEQITLFKDSVLNKISNRDVIPFRLGDLTFDNTAIVKDNVLTQTALNKLLSSIKVKNNFLEYKIKMEPDDWDTVKSALQNANKDTEYWGKRITGDDGKQRIVKLFQRTEIPDSPNYFMTFKNYFDMILSSLESTQINFALSKSYFDDAKEQVILNFVDDDTQINAIIQGDDIWKRGCNLTFDLLEYSSAPFFERLICTNGMVAQKMGFKTNIKNKNFNENSIQKEISKILIHGDEKLDSMLMDAVYHLKSADISLNEFYNFKKWFEYKSGEEKKYEHIIEKMFDETELYKTYGVNLKEQTDKWLSTASSGRNGYDFLNDMTWAASHPVEVRLEENDAHELKVKSADLLFKWKYDLEDVAPKVNLKVNKVFRNNN